MKIGCDLDNVTFEFQPFWGSLYNHDFDKSLDLESLTEWDDLKTRTHFEKYSDFFEWFDATNGWAKMPTERGAFGGLSTLARAGHTIDFITSRDSPGAIKATEEWYRTCPWYRRNGLVTAMEDKGTVPCSVYIDDSPSVINKLVDRGKTVIVFDKPWNKTIPKPAPCEDCDGKGKRPIFTTLNDGEKDVPCVFCDGTGDSTPLYRAHGWWEVVRLIERLSNRA